MLPYHEEARCWLHRASDQNVASLEDTTETPEHLVGFRIPDKPIREALGISRQPTTGGRDSRHALSRVQREPAAKPVVLALALLRNPALSQLILNHRTFGPNLLGLPMN